MNDSTIPAPTPIPGTLGIGVGYLLPPIPSRGETEPPFHSVVWFPVSERAEAEDFLAGCNGDGWVLREGIAL